ncbi:MAG: nif-specific transcriptional activator NifA [Desulfovibrio sp.]|jgi:Nif-specific regulatory protein|nr:nif-specific transcriptional activator NifA [Desulfovibrio sp.]
MTILLGNLKLQVLSSICQIIDTALDLEKALSEVLRILSESLSMKRATITLADPDNERLAITASHGLSREERQRGVYELDEGVTGLIFQTAKPYVVPDIRREPLFLDKTGSRHLERGRVSFIGVPITSHGRCLGVLNVDRLFGDEVAFEEDLSFLTVVATLIGQFLSLNEKIKAREEALVRENLSLRSQITREQRGPYIVGKSQAMQDVEHQVSKVAPTRATVLLLGESGTGKTLIARVIHELSGRKGKPFMKVNCASIPENLLESELFGYERGAFTGAVGAKPGRFEDAHEGTIFLDEIGELPLGIQAKLLRVLQDKEFERLGSNTTRKVDVRVVAATNRDLGELAERGAFRPDLYYRLSVFPVQVPPLRQRKEDIPVLLNHFIDKVAREYSRTVTFTPRALSDLTLYDWPGNVREMENLIERLVIMSDGERVDATFLKPYLSQNAASTSYPQAERAGTPQRTPGLSSLKAMERSEVLAALRRNGWVQYKAAEDLGITPRQIGYRIKKYGLDQVVDQEAAAHHRR